MISTPWSLTRAVLVYLHDRLHSAACYHAELGTLWSLDHRTVLPAYDQTPGNAWSSWMLEQAQVPQAAIVCKLADRATLHRQVHTHWLDVHTLVDCVCGCHRNRRPCLGHKGQQRLQQALRPVPEDDPAICLAAWQLWPHVAQVALPALAAPDQVCSSQRQVSKQPDPKIATAVLACQNLPRLVSLSRCLPVGVMLEEGWVRMEGHAGSTICIYVSQASSDSSNAQSEQVHVIWICSVSCQCRYGIQPYKHKHQKTPAWLM